MGARSDGAVAQNLAGAMLPSSRPKLLSGSCTYHFGPPLDEELAHLGRDLVNLGHVRRLWPNAARVWADVWCGTLA